MSRTNHRGLIPSIGRSASEACIARLSLYLRELARLGTQRIGFISSRRLAKSLGLTDAQVRRDLSCFGQFGTSGRGYDVRRLHDRLAAILGVSDRLWNVALVGVGNLGSALLAYRGFRKRGFLIRTALDTDPKKIGRTICGVSVSPTHRLPELVKAHRIQIGLIAVPIESAQAVCDQFIASGVQAIVNFAPVHLEVPSSVRLRVVDLATELERLAFHLARSSS